MFCIEQPLQRLFLLVKGPDRNLAIGEIGNDLIGGKLGQHGRAVHPGEFFHAGADHIRKPHLPAPFRDYGKYAADIGIVVEDKVAAMGHHHGEHDFAAVLDGFFALIAFPVDIKNMTDRIEVDDQEIIAEAFYGIHDFGLVSIRRSLPT